MKRLAINLILFCGLLYGVLYALDSFYSQALKTRPINKIIWLFNKQNENYDFAVLGDSRVLDMIDVKAIEKYSNLRGINLGTRGSKPMENCVILDRFLQTNKVKIVLLQLDRSIAQEICSVENPKMPFFETYSFMPYAHDKDVYGIISQYCSPIKYLPWRYFPFVRYAEFNNEYSLDKIFKTSICPWDDVGYESSPRVCKSPIVADTILAQPVISAVDINLNWAKKIIETCRMKNIKVIVFTSPFHKVEQNYPITTYTTQRIVLLSGQNNVPYWDFTKLFFNSPDSLFSDSFHTNHYAADSLSKAMANGIVHL